jgi:PhoPQ-activated pathogenicity-related protein
MKKIIVFAVILACCLACKTKEQPITPETALKAYLNNADPSFSWEVVDKIHNDGTTHYKVVFTSQKWREYTWKHDLVIIVPDVLKYHDALLYMTGGINVDGKPVSESWTNKFVTFMNQTAKNNMAITAVLLQVPNQPLYGELTEDALISYTMHNYLNDGDMTWPLLFPMTKSAVRAMDVVQQFSGKNLKWKVKEFVVSGQSKRGWTTWLAGANDKRVKAIAPMVIDVLNMPVSVDYQIESWKEYSVEIEDYVKLGIAQQIATKGGLDIVAMVDPYSYRKSLTMTKMLFMGTNDPYWPVDAVKNYIDDIPGTHFFCYVPNAKHNLGDGKKAFSSLDAFFEITITGEKHPICDYTINGKPDVITLHVKTTPDVLVGAELWMAQSPDQDFRNDTWSGKDLNVTHQKDFTVNIDYPTTGFKAFFVDLKYQTKAGREYTKSTRMFLTTDKTLL